MRDGATVCATDLHPSAGRWKTGRHDVCVGAIPAGFTDSLEFVKALFEKAGVLVTPGSAFGPSGEGHVRMALVQDEDAIALAVRRIAESGILQSNQ